MSNIKAIITGVGRSGTTYLARLLTSMNMPCGHESIFDYSDERTIKERLLNNQKRVISTVSTQKRTKWIDPQEIKADSSYLSAPYLWWPELSDVKIIHVYRNPILVARSLIMDFNYFHKNKPNKNNPFNKLGYEEKIWEFIPELSEIKTQQERFCYFYIKWNELAKKNYKDKENLKINIEDKNLNDKIIKFLNIKNKLNLFNYKKENTFDFKNNKFNINDIPEGSIKKDFINFIRAEKLISNAKIL